jgi:hypothetical protein
METEGSLPHSQLSPLDLILSHMKSLHILIPYFFEIHFNIIFPPTPITYKLTLPSGFQPHFFSQLSQNPILLHLSTLQTPGKR